MDYDLRECLAIKLGEIGWVLAPEQRKIHDLLVSLARDHRAFVAGAACSSWCNLSFGDEAFLDRQMLWELLDELSEEGLVYFFDATYSELLFDESEGYRIVDFAQKLPQLESSFVWLLHTIGGADVAAFMQRFLKSEENGLWALAYFARCPSRLARAACKKELEGNENLLRSLLAAACLSRLGSEEATAFLIKWAANPVVYGWVRDLIRPALEEAQIVASTKSERARLGKVIRRLEGE